MMLYYYLCYLCYLLSIIYYLCYDVHIWNVDTFSICTLRPFSYENNGVPKSQHCNVIPSSVERFQHRYKANNQMALISGNVPVKYGQQYGTFSYLHLLDPEIPSEDSQEQIKVLQAYLAIAFCCHSHIPDQFTDHPVFNGYFVTSQQVAGYKSLYSSNDSNTYLKTGIEHDTLW